MLNKDFWEERYALEQTGWDIGEISQPLRNYFEGLANKKQHILIPGCGRAYEAEFLFK